MIKEMPCEINCYACIFYSPLIGCLAHIKKLKDEKGNLLVNNCMERNIIYVNMNYYE